MKTAFYNGVVYTGELPFQEAFTVCDGCFYEVGSEREILSSLLPGDEKIDLKGRFVCAGFNDSHMHLLNFGHSLHAARLAEHTGSLRDLIDHMRTYLKKNPPRPGQWLIGRGWNQDYFSDVKRMPTRFDLDSISADIPIQITRACGHCCVVNSKALQIAGIDRNTPDPEGGTIGRDADGEPDGRIYEKAFDLVETVCPLPDKESVREMLMLAMKEVNSYGITSVQTDDYDTFHGLPWQLINDVYRELESEGLMTVRVNEQCNFSDLPELQQFVEAGNVTGSGSDFFRIGPLKMVDDGSLGSRTAHLSRPYLTGEEDCGFSLFSPEHLKEMIIFAHTHGMQTAIHAIGDACLDEVLDAVEAALTLKPCADHRHGVVHCQISRKDQLERIARQGMHVYAQSIFLDYDNHIVEKLVPADLAESSYSWKTLLKKGVCVSNGSDCPVELPDVMAGIQCAVTRRSLDGTGPFLAAESFTVQEALDSFTSAGAAASFEEDKKGRIRKGMLADFVILDGDPFCTDPMQLHNISAAETYLGGNRVYVRPQHS